MSNANPLLKMASFGQSIWLDFLHREMLQSGALSKLIEEDGVSGVTSNPAIFKEAIAGSSAYDDVIAELVRSGATVEDIYQNLVVDDVREAADQFRELYDNSKGENGYVSLEVSPLLARDVDGTIEEGLFLWKELDRPNVMIKVPATREGCAAIRHLTAEGVNVNATLLFSISRYQEVAEAYIAGLEKRIQAGKSVASIVSVASFFLSRIDTLIDPQLEDICSSKQPTSEMACQLRGRIAVASAKLAYQLYKEIFSRTGFKKLEEQGARPQRLLWASTGTKNASYSDVKYVDELIGLNTVNTVPVKTMDAFRDHGHPAATLEKGLKEAEQDLARLQQLGIDLDLATQELEEDGIRKFVEPFDSLFAKLAEERLTLLGEEFLERQDFDLGIYSRYFQKRLHGLEEEGFSSRLWNKDATLWKHGPEAEKAIVEALGWLDVPEKLAADLQGLMSFADEIRTAGFTHILVMGMGGSSMTPLCFARSLSVGDNGLPLRILDSTCPETVLRMAEELPFAHTLFIEASKSGTTAEPNAFSDFFYTQVEAEKGGNAGVNFVAITDSGTQLVKKAESKRYRRVFTNFSDIGGRYSALSYFGLLPAALMGLDIEKMVASSLAMKDVCGPTVPERKNPGVILGAAMGELALSGRDKITFILPESIQTLGLWLEQLIAESTGKEGTGILPVSGEPFGDAAAYGDDRLFVCYQIEDDVSPVIEKLAKELRKYDHPVISLRLTGKEDLVQEFFRWEVATATAGAILRINPFDQPNVQESKTNTLRILNDLQGQRGLKEERKPLYQGQGMRVFGSEQGDSLKEILTSFLEKNRPRDYVALMAYLSEKETVDKGLQEIQTLIRDRYRLAATCGYGPRFLHSTGQFHKGGPNTGLFIQFTRESSMDEPIPGVSGVSYSFATLIDAQAKGDLEALEKYDRRVVRIHFDAAPEDGLAVIADCLREL